MMKICRYLKSFKLFGALSSARKILLVLVMVWISCGAGLVLAQEKNVSEEILDILRDREQITDQEYKELKQKAEAEKKATKGEETDFRAYWKDGLRLDTRDKQIQLRIGGRIEADWAVYGPDDTIENDFQSPDIEGFGTEFRRARLFVSGSLYDAVEFKAQYDFAGGDADFYDVFIGLKHIPVVGNVKVGHLKEPFSLNYQTSDKYILFMERSLQNLFVPGYNMGIMFSNTALDDHLTWRAGIFQEANSFGDSFNDFSDYNVTARVTYLPWYVDDGSRLLHLGLSYSSQFRSEGNTAVRYRTRPETHISDAYLVDTGAIPADGVSLINPEISVAIGSLSFQGEYIHSFVDSNTADDPEFSGYYIEAGYFFTGEHRNYNRKNGYYSMVKPIQNFHPAQNKWGGWQMALRYSSVDLNDKDISGGEESDFTVGLNWYLNPNVRFMLNYIYADMEDRVGVADGSVNIYQGRFQIEF